MVYMVYYTISQTNEFKGQTLKVFFVKFAFVPTTQQGTRTRTHTHTRKNFFENAVNSVYVVIQPRRIRN